MDVLDATADLDRAEGSSIKAIARRVTSFPVMLGSLLAVAVLGATYSFTLDPDVWWHIKVGQSILQTHHWPTVDIYSFTAPGRVWVTNQWLGEVLMALAVRVRGLQGLEGFQLIVGSAILIALYVYGAMRSGNSKAAFAAAAALVPFTSVFLSMRPQMLSLLFLVITYIILERFRRGQPGALWVFPFLFVLWINTHPFFVFGLGVIGVYWACGLFEFRLGSLQARRWLPAERRRLELILFLSVLGLGITPYGIGLAVLPFRIALKPSLFTTNIIEWIPMPFEMAVGKVCLILVLAVFVAQIALRLEWPLEDMALLLGTTMMAFLHIRFLLLCVPLVAPVLSSIVAHWLEPYDAAKDKYALNALLMLAGAAILIWRFPSRAELEQKVAGQYPVAAVEYLRGHPVPEPMYNTYGYGGYLIATRSPEHKVFIDGRIGPYELAGVFADYIYINQLRSDALDILNRYRVQSCLLGREEALATLLGASSQWRKIYQDKVAVLFVRNQADAGGLSTGIHGHN